jgi:transposase
VDATGQPALVLPNVARAKLLELIASLPPSLIGMEACSSARHWAREFQRSGYTERLMGGLRLRIKGVDFDRRLVIVREAEGSKDRVVMPQSLAPALGS